MGCKPSDFPFMGRTKSPSIKGGVGVGLRGAARPGRSPTNNMKNCYLPFANVIRREKMSRTTADGTMNDMYPGMVMPMTHRAMNTTPAKKHSPVFRYGSLSNRAALSYAMNAMTYTKPAAMVAARAAKFRFSNMTFNDLKI